MSDFIVKKALKNEISIIQLVKVLKYKMKFKKDHPDYFDPSGLLCFCGWQGDGKSLTAVAYVKKLMEMYPKSILLTNANMTGIDETRVNKYTGIDSLVEISNDEYGVIVYIDEIHNEFNSLESKNIPITVFSEISQQRKQRTHIIGTSQRYKRIAKPFREQMKYVVECRCYFGLIQFNRFILGRTIEETEKGVDGKVSKHYLFNHTLDMYDSYDTLEKMKRYNEEWKKGR